MHIDNPWHELPETAPFVLPQDTAAALGARRHLDLLFDLSLLPEPYFGLPSAPVVLLTLNPGWSADDAPVHATPRFRTDVRESLAHLEKPHPFLHLRPGLQTPGALWWTRRARALTAVVGIEAVSRGLLCLQFIGYKSKEYEDRDLRLPSQTYTFHLLRQALTRKALVCVMRSWTLWCSAVPELIGYPNLVMARSVRSPFLSPGNLGPDGFNEAYRLLS